LIGAEAFEQLGELDLFLCREVFHQALLGGDHLIGHALDQGESGFGNAHLYHPAVVFGPFAPDQATPLEPVEQSCDVRRPV
jgi:hypothetical protein